MYSLRADIIQPCQRLSLPASQTNYSSCTEGLALVFSIYIEIKHVISVLRIRTFSVPLPHIKCEDCSRFFSQVKEKKRSIIFERILLFVMLLCFDVFVVWALT